MKRIKIILTILTLAATLQASTYIQFWVNGAMADTSIQGDDFAWEYDVSIPGGTATVSIYQDLNNNGTIEAGDVLLVSFPQTDGDLGTGGPGDSSAVQDGIIYSNLGSFGFTPGQYIFQIEDMNDLSSVIGVFFIQPLSGTSVSLSGKVSIEGISAPNDSLADVMIMAQPEDMSLGYWTGTTDSTGNYTIILPDSAVNTIWNLDILNGEFEAAGYYTTPADYQNITLSTGDNSPYDFVLTLSTTVVYGSVYDELGQPVVLNDRGYLENRNMSDGNSFTIIDGNYTAYAVFAAGDTANVPFQLYLDGQNIIPDYLVPNTWNNSYYQFTLSEGDSLRRDIRLRSTDSMIYAQVTEQGNTPAGAYMIDTYSDSGHTWAGTDISGFTSLSIRSGDTYYVNLRTEENGQSMLPPGYIVEGGNSRQAVAGDTIYFNLIPADGMVSGRFLFKYEDRVYADLSNFGVEARDSSETIYNGIVNNNDSSYTINLINETYNVQVYNWSDQFLSMPAQYQNITVASDTTDTLNFQMSYRHATLRIKLIGAPGTVFQNYQWRDITTMGNYPWVYQTYTDLQPDTSYTYSICDGDWYIPAIDFGPDYISSIQDTVLTVSDADSSYELVFVYTYNNPSGIANEPKVPKEFSVEQNYPNPFNPATNIEFGLPQRAHVLLEIFDITGRKIATLINGEMEAGRHVAPWNAADFASGIYFYRIQAGKYNKVKKMTLLK